MPIQVTCNSCGKSLKAKDSAAGKRVKCPQCGDPISIPEAVYDAEDAGGGGGGGEYSDDEYGEDYGDDQYDYDVSNAPSAEQRKPCPACGEMIVDGAVKCRFCGEIFDAALKKKSRKAKSGGGDDDDMTTGDWVVACLCANIGCIAGIIWMIQGKPKGAKMLGVSFVMQFVWGAIIQIIKMAQQGM